MPSSPLATATPLAPPPVPATPPSTSMDQPPLPPQHTPTSPSATTASAPPSSASSKVSPSPPIDIEALKQQALATHPRPPLPPQPADSPASLSPSSASLRRRSIVGIQTTPGSVTPVLSSAQLLPSAGPSAEDDQVVFELEQQLDLVYHDDDVKHELQAAFFRACTAGDARKVGYLLKHCAGDVSVNAKDDSGCTGLMLAACFGHETVCKLLAEDGRAELDVQDNNGWTALMWATNNSRDAIVEYLLDHGVNPDISSTKGRTVKDFLERAHLPQRDKLQSIFYSETRSNYTSGRRSSTGSSDGEGSLGAATSITSLTSESYYVPSLYGVDYREMCDIVGTTVPAQLVHIGKDNVGNEELPPPPPLIDLQVFLNEEEEGLIDFAWDGTCPPDQMFVFSESGLDHLLHVAIRRLSDPTVIRSQNNNPAGFTRRPVSANVLFLAARYAGYYGSQDMLDTLFARALDMLEQVLRPKKHDMMFLGYWLANCSRLLYFLKKDAGLVVSTLAHQVRLNELIQDIFVALIKDAQQRLAGILDAALLNHDTIPGYASIRFRERKTHSPPPEAEDEGGLGGMLRRALSTSTNTGPMGGASLAGAANGGSASGGASGSTTPPKISNINRLSSFFTSSGSMHGGIGRGGASSGVASASASPVTGRRRTGMKSGGKRTPRTITTVLSSTLYVLQTFQIHPSLVHQAIEQLFFYLGAATFNRLLSRPELCCRWKAMQIRMNLSHLEDWVRSNPIPAPNKDSFTRHLQPVISLLQMLQIVTHFKTLESFTDALRESDHLAILNWSQLRRALDLYTYEEDEAEVAPAIIEYIARCADRSMSDPKAVRRMQRAGRDDFDVDEDEQEYDSDEGVVDGRGRHRRAGSDSAHSAIDLSITADLEPSRDADPLASPPLSPPPLDEHGVPIYQTPQGSPTIKRRSSTPNKPIKGPMVVMHAHTHVHAYAYFALDEAYWMPFAVPTNVGERVILRIVDGDESYIEEAPVLTQEVVDMLDGKC